MAERRVIIVGAGLAGLACAVRLQECGIKFRILEKSAVVGGRVQTNLVSGFQLDRGFQVLLTAYPRTRALLDFSALELKSFHAGAQIRYNGKFHTLGDPLRRPADTLATLLAPIGSFKDKATMLRVRQQVTSGTVGKLMERPEITAAERLREFGFSDDMVGKFFRPFLGGIFLEPNLTTSSRKFEFVMRMFSEGSAALPKRGMDAIPQQLASRLKAEDIQLGCGVKAIQDDGVALENGEVVPGDAIVLATSESEANRLRGKAARIENAAATCLYYAADKSPVRGPWLVLNGDGKGPINNLCVPTEVHASYAPDEKSLVSVTVLGAKDGEVALEREVRSQLVEWYGETALSWQHLRTYAIPEALTLQAPPLLDVVKKPLRVSEKLYVCGDYLSITSIEGAISSGVRCADELFGAQ